MKLSIIIPVLNEGVVLDHTLQSLSRCSHEIIIVDGDSNDGTLEVASQYTPHVLSSTPCRGKQQDKGARYAHGDAFLFLHADTILPRRFENMIEETLSDSRVTFGAFKLSIYPSRAALRLIAHMANLRSRWLKMPYGDQGLFMRRSDYFQVGGFKDLPIMEDVDLVQRLNRKGQFKLARGFVKTSARRWESEGVLYTTLRNLSLMIRYLRGESPYRFYHLYSDVR